MVFVFIFCIFFGDREPIREIMLGPLWYHPALVRNSDAGFRGLGFQV